jgi:glutamyl-Q tRNA(Asp) synthetase
MNITYKGRFAPTPSGPAHLGTLFAALASYLQAHAMQGEWHVRVDDIDPPREVAGAADSILRTLENFSLHWDGPVVYQSKRQDAYEDALQQLADQGDIFVCSCSRKQISQQARQGANGMIYPGTCRAAVTDRTKPLSIRLLTHDQQITVKDRLQGSYRLNMQQDVGDFVIRRADGLIAYHLATVVDDALDNFTEIVRGKDQLSLTPLHIDLQQRLDLPTPDYAHLPLLINEQGIKLGKSTWADPVDKLPPADVWKNLFSALKLTPENDLFGEPAETILQWAINRWQLTGIKPDDIVIR